MSKGSSGLFHGTVGEHATEEQLFQKANNAIKHLVEKTPNGNKKSMVVGAYDIKTGRVVAAFAGACPKRIADELKERAKLVGGIGTHGVTKRNIVGVCAEFHAVNSLLLAGSRWQDIRLTPAIRPRIGMEIPYCDNCRIMFYDIIDKKRS